MTTTDTAPAPADAETTGPGGPADGLYGLLSSSNHSTIGRLWILSSVPLLVATLVVGVLVGIERVDGADVDLFGGVNEYFRYWTLFRVALPLLVVAPLFVGIATLIVPLQVGSKQHRLPAGPRSPPTGVGCSAPSSWSSRCSPAVAGGRSTA